MGNQTGISWTGATWNPWQGCRTKSEGCRFCYMFREKRRYKQDPSVIHRSSHSTFGLPLKLQRQIETGKRARSDCLIFTCSWSDWFIEEADVWRDDAWGVIRACPSLIFQILTKRVERIADHLPPFWDEIRDRCWLGASAEDQRNYDRRRPYLDVDFSPVMWWSFEPLIGPIKLRVHEYQHKPAWIVVGGESGLTTEPVRPMHPDWARDIRDECVAANIPFHFKQWGEWLPQCNRPFQPREYAFLNRDGRFQKSAGGIYTHSGWTGIGRVGTKAAGRVLDGRTWDEFPEVAR